MSMVTGDRRRLADLRQLSRHMEEIEMPAAIADEVLQASERCIVTAAFVDRLCDSATFLLSLLREMLASLKTLAAR